MINIYFNDIEHEVNERDFLSDILNRFGFEKGYFAVAINREFISRKHYNKTVINDGDRIEIITPMQGG